MSDSADKNNKNKPVLVIASILNAIYIAIACIIILNKPNHESAKKYIMPIILLLYVIAEYIYYYEISNKNHIILGYTSLVPVGISILYCLVIFIHNKFSSNKWIINII